MRCIKIKLSDEQKKVVEENHNLIYSFLHKNHLDINEWYGDAAIGCCMGVATFNEGKGSLSTYLFKCMSNQIINKKRRSKSINTFLSLDEDLRIGVSLNETLSNNEDWESDVDELVDFNKMLNELSENKKKILLLKLQGYNQTEISKMLKISRQRVSQIIIDVRNYFMLKKEG